MGRMSRSPSTIPWHRRCPLADLFQQALKAPPPPPSPATPLLLLYSVLLPRLLSEGQYPQTRTAENTQAGLLSAASSGPRGSICILATQWRKLPTALQPSFTVSTGTGCSTSLSPSACLARSWFQSLCFCTFPDSRGDLPGCPWILPLAATEDPQVSSAQPVSCLWVRCLSRKRKRERVCLALHPGETTPRPRKEGK